VTETRQHINYPLWGGVAFLSVILLALIYGFWLIADWLEDEQQAPIQYISVTGETTQINDQDVEALIREKHAGSFFELDVDKLHRDLERMPWIYHASVRKRWPNSINVYVVEQVAAARWNSDLLLNQYGESFPARFKGNGLPELYGPGGSEETALRGYKAMQSLLNSAELSINELTLSERFAWNIRLSNGVKLNLGRIEFVNRLQRFVDIYPLLQQQDKQLDYVDLRYDTGLAVGWKTSQETQKES
jgi:cell division protein FtsQ